MKKLISAAILSLFVIIAASLTALAADSAAEYEFAEDPDYCSVCADIDKDGRVTVDDARGILRAAVKLNAIPDGDFGRYDANADDEVTVDDARCALRIAVGLDDVCHQRSRTVTLKEATCAESGRAAFLCAHCGKLYSSAVVPSPGHVSNGRVLVKKSTCTEQGYYEYRCKFCNKLISTQYIDLIDHEWEGVKVSCTKRENTLLTCKNCGAQKITTTETNNGHTYTLVTVKEATCTEDGLQKWICSVCGKEADKEPEIIKCPGSHRTVTRRVSTVSCRTEGKTVTVCTRCNEILDEKIIPRLPHTVKEGTYTVIKEPTCTEKGSAKYTCSVCMQLITEDIERIAHDTIDGTAKITLPATCLHEGTMIGKCTVCGDYTEVLPKLNHRPSCWTESSAPNCTEKGVEVRRCIECDTVLDTRETEIDPANHNYAETDRIEATCKKAGAVLHTCTRCGKTYTTTIPKKNHIKDPAPVLVEEHPELGFNVYAYKCAHCGEELERFTKERID